jgi:hypothetical protein
MVSDDVRLPVLESRLGMGGGEATGTKGKSDRGRSMRALSGSRAQAADPIYLVQIAGCLRLINNPGIPDI